MSVMWFPDCHVILPCVLSLVCVFKPRVTSLKCVKPLFAMCLCQVLFNVGKRNFQVYVFEFIPCHAFVLSSCHGLFLFVINCTWVLIYTHFQWIHYSIIPKERKSSPFFPHLTTVDSCRKAIFGAWFSLTIQLSY